MVQQIRACHQVGAYILGFHFKSVKLDNSPRAGGAKLDRLSHDIRVMTVLQGPVLYLHFPLTYKTDFFPKKVQKVVQNGVQKRGPPDELCNAQILVFACFFRSPNFGRQNFVKVPRDVLMRPGVKCRCIKSLKMYTQTHRHISFQPWAQRKKRFAQL